MLVGCLQPPSGHPITKQCSDLADMHEIKRRLWFYEKDERKTLTQDDLITRTEPLIVLGEAGMGKSHLLRWLSTFPDVSKCTARQLINRADPTTLIGNAATIVIDALDEVSAQQEGAAVDLVLQRLGAIGYPRFILSCRASDWRSATGLEAIREQYSEEPIELNLEPFSHEDAELFLEASLGKQAAEVTIKHFEQRGLESLLGNPQTLSLIAKVAKAETLPETKAELFEHAIHVLRVEHQESKAEVQLPKDTLEISAGAAFAGLILTGSEAVSRAATANIVEGDIPLVEVSRLPGGELICKTLAARLYSSIGAERFTYLHRSIGEFLGANWLSRMASTARKRRRLLAIFHNYGLVPASIRGIHAWLARDPALANAVIKADPMGLIEYGDADDLTTDQARNLLRALEELSHKNPSFRSWGPYSVRGIARPDLIMELRRIILTIKTPFYLRLLVLEAIKSTAVAKEMVDELRSLVLDAAYEYVNRKAAGIALIDVIRVSDWARVGFRLREMGDESSVRLAIELMDDVGYEPFSDELIADFVIKFTSKEEPVSGPLWFFERSLPDTRIDGFLNALAEKHVIPDESGSVLEDGELTDLVNYLVVRRIELRELTAEQLWVWLKPFEQRFGYRPEISKKLSQLILRETDLRRGIQSIVLLSEDPESNIFQKGYSLSRVCQAFIPSEDDVFYLLGQLNPAYTDDNRWRDIIRLMPHDLEVGVSVREAAIPFANGDSDIIGWINGLSENRKPDWQIEEEAKAKKRKVKEDLRREAHRKSFLEVMGKIKGGSPGPLINLSKAYLKLFSDVGRDIESHEVISAWVGEDIGEAALAGFEAYLVSTPPKLTATAIAESKAESRFWPAQFIIAAALAERIRTGRGLSDLSDERIIAGFLIVDDIHLTGLPEMKESIRAELYRRELLEAVSRIGIEPQLAQKCSHVAGLYFLMRDERNPLVATKLAAEWLDNFPDLPEDVEAEIVGRLFRSGKVDGLRNAFRARKSTMPAPLDMKWLAVGLIVDFEETVLSVEHSVDKSMLWHIRAHTGSRFKDWSGPLLSVPQLEWIISTFRASWPMSHRGPGVSSGDNNDYDASEYILHLISRLGGNYDDASVEALKRIAAEPDDGYTESIKSVLAEQAKSRVDSLYLAPTLDEIIAVLSDAAPLTAADLQEYMMEELEVAQARIISDDAESWRGFYESNIPADEERCRDHLIGIIRQECKEITFTPEAHVAADKEVDIACSVGSVRIPIEIKGQWHKDLWQGADAQLDKLYTPDWRASGRGIYLVLWFGVQPHPKAIKSPGRGLSPPSSPNELKEMLIARSNAAQEGRVKVFVLDVSRP